MASPPPYPDTGTSQGSGPPPGSGQRAGWLHGKTAAIAVLVVALLAVMPIMHLTGALGPGTHG